jgi:hypothetical protein
VENKQARQLKHIEKAVGVLSKLGNTNILGCLVPYEDEILHSLSAK